jgi:hypothetical protein
MKEYLCAVCNKKTNKREGFANDDLCASCYRKMITKDELRYALLLSDGDLELAYLILDFVSNFVSKGERRD